MTSGRLSLRRVQGSGDIYIYIYMGNELVRIACDSLVIFFIHLLHFYSSFPDIFGCLLCFSQEHTIITFSIIIIFFCAENFDRSLHISTSLVNGHLN